MGSGNTFRQKAVIREAERMMEQRVQMFVLQIFCTNKTWNERRVKVKHIDVAARACIVCVSNVTITACTK